MLLNNNVYEEANDLVKSNLDDANKTLDDLSYDTQCLKSFTDLIGDRKF